MQDERYSAIECILFVSGEPVSLVQLQRALDKPQKHNGLAAAGYAVQQCRVGSGILQIRQQIVKNLLLFSG